MCQVNVNRCYENTPELSTTSLKDFESVFLGSRVAKKITSIGGLVFMTETWKKPPYTRIAVLEKHGKTEVSSYNGDQSLHITLFQNRKNWLP